MNFNLPESFLESYEHFNIPSYLKNGLILSDIHVPYHHIPSLEESIEYGIIKDVDFILINGDGLDCYSLSIFNPDPRLRNFGQEIEAFRQLISVFRKALPKAKIFYKLGNHEERFEKIMIARCKEFLGIKEFEFDELLACEGMEIIKDQRIVYVGNLPVLHGHEVGIKYANVNPARSLFLRTYKNSLCSHLHRTSNHNEQSLDGKIISCWSTGHLSDPHPKYRRINNWNHGIARVEKDKDGDFEVINFRIMRNKLYRT
jgi:predicted phosphodiesterase